MSLPTDPLFSQQWHFDFLGGKMEAVWADYTGAGVKVGIYDDGVQYTHPDLAANYDPSLHVAYNGFTHDGVNVGNNGHGTSVAGLIAAARNGEGVVGIAYDSSITGVNIFDPASDLYINKQWTDNVPPHGFWDAIRQSASFDVVNNSWGMSPGFQGVQNHTLFGSFAQQTVDGWYHAAATGRGGLGTVVVKSSGNDDRNANGDGLNVIQETIAVAAVGNTGFSASYSNFGSNILVSAPGSERANVLVDGVAGLGIVTTDLLGTQGYNLRADKAGAHDYTDDFGGTSAAGPIVAAVATLVLDANENLGWRDVQKILALSATHTGSALDALAAGPNENGTWFVNGADNWNGGGMHFHVNYGFGMVNAYNAVRMAEAWDLFSPAAQTSANQASATMGFPIGGHIANNATYTFDFTVPGNLVIEHADITISISHTYFSDLRMWLVAPDGSRHMLLDGSTGGNSVALGGLNWTFGVSSLMGMSTQGTWQLEVTDVASPDFGTLHGMTVNFRGTAATFNDVYHFTDEFLAMAALDPSRAIISDTNGGTDWLNMAAMTGNLGINLNPGSGSSVAIAGTNWSRVDNNPLFQIAAGTIIENVVTGDGDDTVFGNSAANIIYGMRGNDTLHGGGGDDRLYGGRGNDFLYGAADNDWLYGDEGDDFLRGDAGQDRLYGGDGSDRLYGGDDRDYLYGDADNDFLYGDAGDDYLYGGEGNDRLYGGEGSDRLYGGAETDHLYGDAGDDFLYGDAGTDFLYGGAGSDRLYGAVGNDRLYGGADNDYLYGEVGNDLLYGDAGDDWLYGGVGQDYLHGGAGTDRLYGDDGDDELHGMGDNDFLYGGNGSDLLYGGDGDDYAYGGTGNDRLYGGEGSDRLYGGDDTDHLYGLAGDDWLYGDAGSDFLYGGDGVDRLYGGDGNDRLYGGIGNDILYGGNGTDHFYGGEGDDSFYGGAGNDYAYFTGNFVDYAISTAGTATVVTHLAGGIDGVDRLYDVEFMVFADQTVAV